MIHNWRCRKTRQKTSTPLCKELAGSVIQSFGKLVDLAWLAGANKNLTGLHSLAAARGAYLYFVYCFNLHQAYPPPHLEMSWKGWRQKERWDERKWEDCGAHQSTPSDRNSRRGCCLRGNNTDLPTEIIVWNLNLPWWGIFIFVIPQIQTLFLVTCTIVTEFQSQEACLLVLFPISSLSLQRCVFQWPGELGL